MGRVAEVLAAGAGLELEAVALEGLASVLEAVVGVGAAVHRELPAEI